MSAEEDNLDIDIYGDGGGDSYQEEDNQVTETQDEQHAEAPASDLAPPAESETAQQTATPKTEDPDDNRADADPQKIESTGTPIRDSVQMPKQAPQTQGLKRKEGPDDRPVEPSATTALFLSELHWWITDDDIRGWANQSGCEDELQEITFSEHKVNGKSKGQAYTLFTSPQAATAVKRKVETFGDGEVYKQKIAVSFSNPFLNPFKTVPKDGGNRKDHQMNRNYNSQGQSTYNPSGGFRGRGGYNNRGMNNVGGYNRGGFQQNQQVPMPGGYPPAGGFQGGPPMGGGMPPYGNFQNRGGMMGGGPGMRGNPMGMRGGRGGMNGMMGMPMGMGPMPGQMPMGMPNGGMPMQGFGNPGFFPQQQDASWNPHGAKRTRQE